KAGGEAGEKAGKALIELGATLEDIKAENYQRVFFSIADSLRTSEITAAKLSAIKEVFGRGGLALLPAFQKGFDTPLAERGTLTDSELKDLKQVKELSGEASGFWKELSNSAGIWAAK